MSTDAPTTTTSATGDGAPLGDLGPLVLGGNVFGWSADAGQSREVLDAFAAAGGRMVDTADVYSEWVDGNSGGESERIVGEWLARRGRRDDVLVATKVAKYSGRPGLSAANVARAAEESLERLQSDPIDLYYAHQDDEDVPQEEYLEAFHALVESGRVRALGASNFTPARLRSANELAARHGWTPFTYSQDPWNAVDRRIEGELVPALGELGVVELPYSALASGFLSGKYRPGASVDSVRARSGERMLQDPAKVAVLERLRGLAEARDVPVATVALDWLRAREVVGAPIASARTPEQLADLLRHSGVPAAELLAV
ncbi:aldo/keto reductase [Auraticoccus monumenti]|uniref:Predicted oxidoreductase n=1 Tax=Auraticoccus monumenti TaxID=675864 RepID=A0A1G7ECF1_9ACTN|nr:aldo/keto reductase [Auraticoccus monumenti]SDE61339.1 Predicted oxidoreductase [Auraticoccus monumenti]